MNPVLAFVIGLFVGAVFIVFIIGLFVVEEDEREKWSKKMYMTYDAIEEIQREERHKMKEEWEKLSPEERRRKLEKMADFFRMFYEDDMK